jgi:hypothetical protein
MMEEGAGSCVRIITRRNKQEVPRYHAALAEGVGVGLAIAGIKLRREC